MDRKDRRELLGALNARRSADIEACVREAIDLLMRDGEAISFYSVANRSGVARSTLYRNAVLKALVIAARDRMCLNGTGTIECRCGDAADAALCDLSHTGSIPASAIEKLLAENAALKERLARVEAELTRYKGSGCPLRFRQCVDAHIVVLNPDEGDRDTLRLVG